MLDYDDIKAMAQGHRAADHGLDRARAAPDPFFVGVEARRRDAEWFAGLWADHGAAGSHLRRLHYQLVSLATPIRKPDGSAYQNTERDWKLLVAASLSARYLDLVPFDGSGRPAERRADDLRRGPRRRPRRGDRGFLRGRMRGAHRRRDRRPGYADAAVPRPRRRLPRAEVHRRGLDREEHPERLARAAVPAPRRQPRRRRWRAERDALAANSRCARPNTARRFGSSTCRTSTPAVARCRRRWRARSSSPSPSSSSTSTCN